jgi:hypothetical protein
MDANLAQLISLTGAFLVLAGYGGHQYAGLRSDSLTYGVLNLVGSMLLAATAFHPLNAGVVLVESAWAALSLGVVVRAWRRGPAAIAGPPGAPGGPQSP